MPDTDQLALGPDATRDEYEAATPIAQALWGQQHPERIEQFLREDNPPLSLTEPSDEDLEQRIAELAEAGDADDGGLSEVEELIAFARKQDGVQAADALARDFKDLLKGRPGTPENDALRERIAARVSLMRDVLREAAAPLGSGLLQRQYFDHLTDEHVVEQNGREIARYSRAELDALEAADRSAALDANEFTTTGTVTPEDAGQWSAEKLRRFGVEYPAEMDDLLQGRPITGIRTTKR